MVLADLPYGHGQSGSVYICYRFNRRFWKRELFDRLIKACVSTESITYSQLIKNNFLVNILYWTDPKRIVRLLPPPLEPDDSAEVAIDYLLIKPVKGQESVLLPGPYYESAAHVSAKYKGHRGMLKLIVMLNQEWGRSLGREGVGWQKKKVVR